MRVNPHTMTPRHLQTSQFQPSIRHYASESSHGDTFGPTSGPIPTARPALCERILTRCSTEPANRSVLSMQSSVVRQRSRTTGRYRYDQTPNLSTMQHGNRTTARYLTNHSDNQTNPPRRATTQSHGGWVSGTPARLRSGTAQAAHRHRGTHPHRRAALTIPAQPAPCARRRTRR